ncbi:hypothetical protein I350_02351 [Cryptococcus amylolentus CBS 6273]|uniref:Uncharacterized protein n=1 Tax=Cryptococcus amylolentus CBS 6273 TaxID=1296118 RepID=A0A1E3KBA5_9TREE|nr:hypothetical protein I350_02351 [Cryptococcus amylolentus CBS 6273]
MSSSGDAHKQTYRSMPDGSDDDDFDDLDGKCISAGPPVKTDSPADVLQSFNKPSSSQSTHRGPSAIPATPPQPTSASPGGIAPETDAEFEASLEEGMESLLRQLAGDHPPGLMPDRPQPSSSLGSQGRTPDSVPMSKEAEEDAWQKAVDMLLSGEGLAALGLDDKNEPSAEGSSGAALERPADGPRDQTADYDETLRAIHEKLKNAGQKSDTQTGDSEGMEALLKALGGDPDLLKEFGGEGGEGDGQLEGMLEGMMAQLMTKEVLEEPMSELASKYPAYLASPPANTSPSDLARYKNQFSLVTRVVETFNKPGFSDEKDGKEVARLVSDIQDLGGPPKEVMGELPEGFDLGALGDEEGCSVM